jgi:RNA polymerase sigma factor (sigma-70 family)
VTASPGADDVSMAARSERLSEHLDSFVAFVRKRVGDPDVAADLVQDCVVKALSKADQLQDDALLVPWFYRILRNAIADLQRRRAGEGRSADLGLDEVAAPPADAETICRCVLGLLDDLPADQAQALRLVDLDAVQPDEAAGRLGITTNLLKVRRHRGRQSLRELLDATCRSCADHGCVDCHCPAPTISVITDG